MGLESANYIFVPKENVAAATSVLLSLGAKKRAPSPPFEDYDRWVLNGEQHWIDVMVGSFGPNSKMAVSIRVALPNPAMVENELRRLMAELMEQAPGRLYDQQTRRWHAQMDEDVWHDIWAAYKKKRAHFQQHFGLFEAPISGDDVFPMLQASKSVD
jgi:hypothetical protein